MTSPAPDKLPVESGKERTAWDYQAEMCKIVPGLRLGMTGSIAFAMVYEELVRLKRLAGELPEGYEPWK